MTAPKIKLTYFDIEGVAEPIRLAFALAGVEFEDDRVKFPQWAELKPKTPHGTLPIMTIDDGPVIVQSQAMLRYAASLDKTGSLYPTDKTLEVEQAIGILGDFTRAWQPNLYIAMKPHVYGYPEGYSKTDEGKAKVKEMRENFVANELQAAPLETAVDSEELPKQQPNESKAKETHLVNSPTLRLVSIFLFCTKVA